MKEVRYVFTWSRMMVMDEFHAGATATHAAFLDFVEMLCRVADIVSYPTADQLVEWQKKHGSGKR
jgi:hypothetical protein